MRLRLTGHLVNALDWAFSKLGADIFKENKKGGKIKQNCIERIQIIPNEIMKV
jgi:hypothetical protein